MHDKLTKSDIEKMEKEIEERKLVKRPETFPKILNTMRQNGKKIRTRVVYAILKI